MKLLWESCQNKTMQCKSYARHYARHLISVFTSLLPHKGFLFDSCTAYLVALYWMIFTCDDDDDDDVNEPQDTQEKSTIYTRMFKVLVLLSLQ